MTVAELMEILRSMPAHRPVIVEYPDFDPCCSGPQTDMASIVDVRFQSFNPGKKKGHTVVAVVLDACGGLR